MSVDQADRPRLILRVYGTPAPETVAKFIEQTGAKLVAATRIYGAAPEPDGTRGGGTDGVQLTFKGVGPDVSPNALDLFPSRAQVIGSDITAMYQNLPSREIQFS